MEEEKETLSNDDYDEDYDDMYPEEDDEDE